MIGPTSLRLRLIAGSLAWVVVSLAAMGIVLVLLFRSHIERRFDRTLHDHLEELAAAAEVDPDGHFKLTWEPADPRFKPPHSGWYWEVRAGADTLRRSPSLGFSTLAAPTPGAGQPNLIADTQGPADECLRLVVQDIVLPERPEPLTIVVAGPRVDIRRDVRSFASMLGLSLALLAVTLAALVLIQVGYGLRPLHNVQAAVNEVRHGSRKRLDKAGSPAEVLPLIEAVNGLLQQREASNERARAEAGDLAHALKTPIAIINNEAARIAGEIGETINVEVARMRRVVEHHLLRARALAGTDMPHAHAALDDILADVRFSIERLYPERTLVIEGQKGMTFAGEADDLGEMIGNLAENAAKWATSRIVITTGLANGRIGVTIDDDGPGLDEAAQSAALARGVRLETMKPGHGLGLSIVTQLVELYGGRLKLSRAPQGGLRAHIDVPLKITDLPASPNRSSNSLSRMERQ